MPDTPLSDLTDLTDLDAEAFCTLPQLIERHARLAPERLALHCAGASMSYRTLAALMDRVAAALQQQGLRPGQAVALCAGSSLRYVAVFLGALRAGAVVVPLPPSATAEALRLMLQDAQAQVLFVDADVAAQGWINESLPSTVLIDGVMDGVMDEAWPASARQNWPTFAAWLSGASATAPAPVNLGPDAPFNLIYSSGTTGQPKGIVQPHGMRWAHVQRNRRYGYGPRCVTLVSTPLYSNTTLVSLIPTLALGGSAVLMNKFEAQGYLQLAQQHRATHSMLVPVQYQRLLAQPNFDDFDLSSFEMKFCTSAPFSAALKAAVLARWPGGLVEFYGLTEGGGTCILDAHLHPHKLHTVGQPAPGSDVRLIDDEGHELPPGGDVAGEVVGSSAGMMTGYHGQPEKTRAAQWFDASGQRFIRTGDIGRFDADGFLTLIDRKKDMLISGGFNIYPSDLEAVLCRHPAVAEAAVVGVPSEAWGETPVAVVVLRQAASSDELLLWSQTQLGKMQRLSALHVVAELPRSAIGKVLKRDLRDSLLLPSVPRSVPPAVPPSVPPM